MNCFRPLSFLLLSSLASLAVACSGDGAATEEQTENAGALHQSAPSDKVKWADFAYAEGLVVSKGAAGEAFDAMKANGAKSLKDLQIYFGLQYKELGVSGKDGEEVIGVTCEQVELDKRLANCKFSGLLPKKAARGETDGSLTLTIEGKLAEAMTKGLPKKADAPNKVGFTAFTCAVANGKTTCTLNIANQGFIAMDEWATTPQDETKDLHTKIITALYP